MLFILSDPTVACVFLMVVQYISGLLGKSNNGVEY
jgi:hypothetical protein